MLKKLGLICTHVDYSIFIMKAGQHSPIINIFINNIKFITTKKRGIIQYVKAKLTIAFSIVDISSISFYLRLKVNKNKEKQIIKLF